MLMLTFTQLIAGGLDSKKGGMPPLLWGAYRLFVRESQRGRRIYAPCVLAGFAAVYDIQAVILQEYLCVSFGRCLR